MPRGNDDVEGKIDARLKGNLVTPSRTPSKGLNIMKPFDKDIVEGKFQEVGLL
jgi:hypothetical protein